MLTAGGNSKLPIEFLIPGKGRASTIWAAGFTGTLTRLHGLSLKRCSVQEVVVFRCINGAEDIDYAEGMFSRYIPLPSARTMRRSQAAEPRKTCARF